MWPPGCLNSNPASPFRSLETANDFFHSLVSEVEGFLSGTVVKKLRDEAGDDYGL